MIAIQRRYVTNGSAGLGMLRMPGTFARNHRLQTLQAFQNLMLAIITSHYILLSTDYLTESLSSGDSNGEGGAASDLSERGQLNIDGIGSAALKK